MSIKEQAIQLISGYRLEQNTINIMREWVLECAVNEDDLEDREDSTDNRIVVWTEKNFAGGIEAFLETI